MLMDTWICEDEDDSDQDTCEALLDTWLCDDDDEDDSD